MIVDPTVIQLKNSLQSYCIIKINPDYIKLCWNRPQLFALLKQLLKSSSRRYIWVSGKYILGFIFVSQRKWRRETLCSAQSAWWELKTLWFSGFKNLLNSIKKKKKTLRFSVSIFYRKDVRRKSKSVEYYSYQQKEIELTRQDSRIFCGGLYVLVFWAGSCQPGSRDC